MLSNTKDAEDIVQDMFFSIWDNRERIHIQENVSGYLFAMAKNRTLNHIRKEAVYRIALEEYEKKMLEYMEEEPFEPFEFKKELIDCINRLPNRSKEILLLHKVKGVKQKEISEKLNISIQTIKNHVWLSLQKLRTCLEEKGVYTS
jgi:RNA polymerase sigma-70 factor (ECF subfamily)